MPDICVWNRCNNNCIMCTNPIGFQDKRASQSYSLKRIIKRAQRDANLWRENRENLNFTGGEPTIHPHFLELCYWFRKNFPYNKLVLATNGRMFSYPSFAKRFLKINNVTIETAVLGPDKKIHDALTRTKGSFRQTTKGIRNILKYRNKDQEIEIRTILTKQNYELTGETLKFVLRNFPSVDRVIIIFPEPEGVCKKNYKITGVTYSQVRKKIASVMEEWSPKMEELRLYHFPLCTVDPELWKHTWVTQRRDEVSYPAVCKECSYRKYCCGIHKEYLEIIGEEEFKPPKAGLHLKVEDNPYHPIIEVL